MPPPKRPNKAVPRRESPVQFRPSGEVSRLLSDFTTAHQVSKNEACQHLIALALVGLDARHYQLVREMATGAMAGAFVQACLHLHAALLAAARLEGEPLIEPRRGQFVADTARDALAVKGLTLGADCTAFLPREIPPPVTTRDFSPPKRRVVKSKPLPEASELPGVVSGESAIRGTLPEQAT